MIATVRWLVLLVAFVAGSVASVSANAWFYYHLALHPFEGWVYAGLGVLLDAAKLTLLEGSISAWSRRKFVTAVIALLIWAASVPFALIAAIGFGAQVQAEAAGPRAEAMRQADTLRTQITALETEQTELKAERLVMEAEDEAGVKKAQQLLNNRGASLAEDGKRGDATAKAMSARGSVITQRLTTITDDLRTKRDSLAAIDVPVTGSTAHPVFAMLAPMIGGVIAAPDLQFRTVIGFAIAAELALATFLLFLQNMAPKMTFRIPRIDKAFIAWCREVNALAKGEEPVQVFVAPPEPAPAPVVVPVPEPVAAEPARGPLFGKPAVAPAQAPVRVAPIAATPAAPEPAAPVAGFEPVAAPVEPVAAAPEPVRHAPAAPGVAEFKPITSRVGARR